MQNRRKASKPHWRFFLAIWLALLIFSGGLEHASSAEPSHVRQRAIERATSQFAPSASDPEIEGFTTTPVEPSGSAPITATNPLCSENDNACLWEDKATPGPLACRTPLIFIHGIHGNHIGSGDVGCYTGKEVADNPRNAPNTCYFRSLISQLSSSTTLRLARNYKIYRFHYRSDVKPVVVIGGYLGDLLDKLTDADPNFDRTITIIAHSMGGLVARAYMNLFSHKSGAFRGRLGGDRVSKLITLGTPHHGSQLSNGLARTQDSFMGSPWAKVFRVLDGFAWESVACLTYLSSCLRNPNRADLHWDDYNGAWKNRSAYNDPAEQNSLLMSLTSTIYDGKIYPYFGYIGDGKLFGRQGSVLDYGKSDPATLAAKGVIVKNYPYQHQGLIVSGVVLQRIDTDNFAFKVPLLPKPSPIVQLFNDGMVTFPSASFSGRADRTKVRSCLGYDHLDMRDGSPFPCRAGSVEKPMVQLLVDDLRFDTVPPCPRVVVSTNLRLASANVAAYQVGQPINGTFTVTNRGRSNLLMKRVVIGGRLAGTCPNNQCPDFGPVPGNITLAPDQSYSYAGSFTPSLAGSYTFSVAYEDANGKWTMPVERENNNTNQLNITVQSFASRVVVSKSLTLIPSAGPYSVGQTLAGSFTITNRGNTNVTLRQVTIGGRLGDACPNNICPDFLPIPGNMSLGPGQSYNYSGQIKLSQPGTYTFYVAYQTPDGKWEMPVKPENGSINKLSVFVQGPVPTLTRAAPSSVAASTVAQTVTIYGTRLSKVIYGELKLPNGTTTYLYLPLNQLFRVTDDQTRVTTKFPLRGTYYVTVWTAEGRSNQYPIVAY